MRTHKALDSRRFQHVTLSKRGPVNMISLTIISMAGIDSGYDTARIIEVLISTLVQKNVISEKEPLTILNRLERALPTDKLKQDPSRLDRDIKA
jgi:hypothetical protein